MAVITKAPYLRATVSGQQRYADLVLPTDEAVSLLIPQLLDLLDEPQDVGQVHLATSLGRVLDPAVPLRDTDLVDGVRLHLVTAHDLPPAPLVHDLVDVVERSTAPGRWTEENRTTALAVLGGLLVAAALLSAFRLLPGFDNSSALAAAAALLGLSALAAARRKRALAWTAAVLALGTASLVLQRSGASGTREVLLLVGLVLTTLAAVAWCTRHPVPSLTSAATLVGLTAVGLITWSLTQNTLRTSAVLATVALLVVGVVPRLALTASGVFTLDSRVADGDEVATVSAEDAVTQAHWTLTGATLVTAAAFAAAAYGLGHGSGIRPWPTGLAAVVSLGFALRARHFPLALHRAALWAAALAGPLGLVLAAERRWPEYASWLVAGIALVGVVVALAGLLHRTPLQQARNRRRANQLETTTILLSVPVLLGVFTVYQDLLKTFQ
jgi:type VII secretion integral membrane protein EccD